MEASRLQLDNLQKEKQELEVKILKLRNSNRTRKGKGPVEGRLGKNNCGKYSA